MSDVAADSETAGARAVVLALFVAAAFSCAFFCAMRWAAMAGDRHQQHQQQRHRRRKSVKETASLSTTATAAKAVVVVASAKSKKNGDKRVSDKKKPPSAAVRLADDDDMCTSDTTSNDNRRNRKQRVAATATVTAVETTSASGKRATRRRRGRRSEREQQSRNGSSTTADTTTTTATTTTDCGGNHDNVDGVDNISQCSSSVSTYTDEEQLINGDHVNNDLNQNPWTTMSVPAMVNGSHRKQRSPEVLQREELEVCRRSLLQRQRALQQEQQQQKQRGRRSDKRQRMVNRPATCAVDEGQEGVGGGDCGRTAGTAAAGDDVADMVARLLAENERARADYEAAVARLRADHEATVTRLRADHEAAVKRSRAEYEATARAARSEGETAAARLRAEHEAVVGRLRAEHEAAVRRLRTDHDGMAGRLRAAETAAEWAAAALKTSRAEHDKAVEALRDARAENAAAVHRLRAEHAAETKRLGDELADLQRSQVKHEKGAEYDREAELELLIDKRCHEFEAKSGSCQVSDVDEVGEMDDLAALRRQQVAIVERARRQLDEAERTVAELRVAVAAREREACDREDVQKLKAKIVKSEREHVAETERLKKEIEELERKREMEIERLHREHVIETKRLGAEHDAKLKQISDRYRREMVRADEGNVAEFECARRLHQKELECVNVKNEVTTNAVRVEIDKLKSEHAAEIERLVNEHETQKAELLMEVATANAIRAVADVTLDTPTTNQEQDEQTTRAPALVKDHQTEAERIESIFRRVCRDSDDDATAGDNQRVRSSMRTFYNEVELLTGLLNRRSDTVAREHAQLVREREELQVMQAEFVDRVKNHNAVAEITKIQQQSIATAYDNSESVNKDDLNDVTDDNQELNTSVESSRTNLVELESQNHKLQCLVTHYKQIIADAEEMLSRLHEHVEQEETRWARRTADLERQVDAARRQLQDRDRQEQARGGGGAGKSRRRRQQQQRRKSSPSSGGQRDVNDDVVIK